MRRAFVRGRPRTDIHWSDSPCNNGHTGYRYDGTNKCVECKRAGANRWARKNRERLLLWKRDYNKRNRDLINAKARARKSGDPSSHRSCQANRRARKIGATGRHPTTKETISMLAAQSGLCAYCNFVGTLTLDHVIPLSSGGSHDIDNLIGCCKSCNSSKGKKSLLVWLAGRRNFELD